MKKLFIDTLGCQMNKSDTERIIGMLSHFGYVITQDEYEADLFIWQPRVSINNFFIILPI